MEADLTNFAIFRIDEILLLSEFYIFHDQRFLGKHFFLDSGIQRKSENILEWPLWFNQRLTRLKVFRKNGGTMVIIWTWSFKNNKKWRKPINFIFLKKINYLIWGSVWIVKACWWLWLLGKEGESMEWFFTARLLFIRIK